MYPLNCSKAVVGAQTQLVRMEPTVSGFQSEESLSLSVSLSPWLELADGAGLIYTSVKEEKNLDLLYKYLVHKVYEFQFTTSALVVEKDAVFM